MDRNNRFGSYGVEEETVQLSEESRSELLVALNKLDKRQFLDLLSEVELSDKDILAEDLPALTPPSQ